VLNTWGDRSRDAKLNEAFAIEEIGAAAKFGITHFQLDDGWQAGRSSNSAFAGGNSAGIWNHEGYWSVHPAKFPRGLRPVLEAARHAGVQIGLWFHPAREDEYANWMRDADQIIHLHRVYGIRLFKIDGVDISSKRADINLRKMFDRVIEQTNGNVTFNLDVTAGRRFGYFYFNEYGNIFLENRYTDHRSYYPHWTLRNLWQLARYLPAQLLQIEFLNNWRNANVYPTDDPLAPARIPFEYCFAVTMMAQPLAWFEASQLPPEAARVAPMIQTYRQFQARLHEGMIFPIGEEPSGFSWTGFQSCRQNGGFIAVYRELNDCPTVTMKLWRLKEIEMQFSRVLGDGADFTAGIDSDGKIEFELPRPMSFALYQYAQK